jgi:plasmid stability protein
MPGIVIRDLPPSLHLRLKEAAQRHHRSMAKEVINILDKELGSPIPASVPTPTVPSKPVTAAWVRATTRSLRESR